MFCRRTWYREQTQVTRDQTQLSTRGRTKKFPPTQSQQTLTTSNNSRLPETAEAKHLNFPEQDLEDTTIDDREEKNPQDTKAPVHRTNPRTLIEENGHLKR